MGFHDYDMAGDAAVANVLVNAGYDPVTWHFEKPKWLENGKTIVVKLNYRNKVSVGKIVNDEWQQMSFTFNVSDLKGLLPEVSANSPFALVNALGGRLGVCDKNLKMIKKALRKKTFLLGEADPIDFFKDFESELRQSAMYNALLWWTKQFKGWEDFQRNYAS